jgi:HNH endonuclease
VDHIHPRKHGGTDDLANLQALCFKCNANKGARDDEDFRKIRKGIDARLSGCIFCELQCPSSNAYLEVVHSLIRSHPSYLRYVR